MLSAHHEIRLVVTIIFMYNMLKWDGLVARDGRDGDVFVGGVGGVGGIGPGPSP